MRLRKIAAAVVAAVTCASGLAALAGPALAAPPSSTADDVQPYIIGGEPATENYTFYTKLLSNGRFGCGGSLIAPLWVVTADHCIGSVTSVRIGGTTLGAGETRNVVQQIGGPSGYDIALLKLGSPSAQTPITITETALNTGTAVRIMGHGQTCPTRGCGSAPNQLMQLDTSLVTGCTANFVPSHELCVGDESGAGACYGDSGGPLVVRANNRWELGGATSRAGRNNPECATAPSIYMKVPAFMSWIEGHTGDLGGDPGPGPGPGNCSGETFTGTLNSGSSAYQPNGSYYYSAASGTHRGCLTGPSGSDYDLYLQKWNGSTWANVKSGATEAANETVEYAGTAGYYRWQVHAYSGSGSYTLKTDKP
ncbi:S1 family peptidase [Lentzea albidocapillata]|uniref:Trypsin n=1 Tax=Lentzea albidocapillata TaxID=40571 RepID=A0A1W2DG34_9PSEU|nr:serine protease [Lentzea albidocapillata]SMC96415.1 Trypsin [Lentzea albidocapillata]